MRRTFRVFVALSCLATVLTGCYGDTESAEDVTDTAATLMAWGVPATTSNDFYFQYGTSTSFGQRTPTRHPNDLIVGATYTIPERITGLAPQTRYYFRLCGKERHEAEFVCGNTRTFRTAMFTNPPKANNYNSIFKTWAIGDYFHADIKIAKVDGKYYGSGTGCSLRVSTDLVNWDYVAKHDDGTGTLVPTEVCGLTPGMYPPNGVPDPTRQSRNGWSRNFWGTEITKVGSTWVLVTSFHRPWDLPERYSDYNRAGIYIATATNPAGPYTWAADATVKHPDWTMIDPSLFTDPSTGKVWLMWSQHKDWPTWTLNNEEMAIELDPADLTKARSGATPTLLMSTAIEPQARELAFPQSGQRIVEGPGVFFHDGQYFFYYAAGTVKYDYPSFGGAPYTLNVASSTTFPKRFTKPAQPTLSGGNGWRLPGHGSFVQDGDGTWWVAVSPFLEQPPCGDPDPEKAKWCFRRVVLQKATYHHDTKSFSVYDGVLKPGPIGQPTP